MSVSPARNKYLNPSSTNPYPTLLEFFNSISREWELLAKDVQNGMMNGITLLPSKNSASDWIDKVTTTMNDLKNNLKKAKKRTGGSSSAQQQRLDALPKSLFGFELFLLGGGDDNGNSDSDNDDDTNTNNKNDKSVLSSASSGVAAQLTSNLLRTIASSHPLTFSGFITVNSKNSPWFSGCFEFQLQVFLGYPDHSCPALYFTSPLSHPELRGGKQLPVVSELFASTRRIKNPFMFRDILDSVRELFVQPVPMFSNEIVQRAALDVKFRSVTSAYFGREDLFELDSFVLQENMEKLNNDAHQGGAGASSLLLETEVNGSGEKHGIFNNANPAARFLAQQEREAEKRSKAGEIHGMIEKNKDHDGDADGFDDVLENNDNDVLTEPYFLHSDLGVILSEAHLPFLMLRKEQQQQKQKQKQYQNNDNKTSQSTKVDDATNNNKTSQLEDSTLSEHERSREEESKRATKWVGRTTTSGGGAGRSGVEAQPTFDKWLNRRLTRVFLPQVSNVA